MSETSWHPHLTVAAIVEQDGRYLCVEEHPRHHNVINQPAGHVEQNESLESAIIREVLEETGYTFAPKAIVGIYYFTGSNGTTYQRVCYTGEITDEPHDGPLDPDISARHWLSLEELNKLPLRSHVVLNSISHYLAGKRFPLNIISDMIGDDV